MNPDEGIVDWVFCETCQQWYHCQCENIDSKIANEKDFNFVCRACEIQKVNYIYVLSIFQNIEISLNQVNFLVKI